MKIQILMSTYNGSEYIRTQLDSIVAQDIEEKTLLIRDDGSVDDTVEIIQEYQKENSWISYYEGENIGVQRSFLELMCQADEDADYIAFADQDDEWLPDKLLRAVACLEKMKRDTETGSDTPLLYCSDKQIVGRNLEPLNVTVSRVVRKISFGNALVQNICTGCTAVANRTLIDLIKRCQPKKPEDIIMHDWWIYLTATCFGKVYYDQEAHIRYRQHGNNTSGAMLNRRSLLKYRLTQLKEPRGQVYHQIREFLACFCDEIYSRGMSRNSNLCSEMLMSEESILKRIQLFFDLRYYRQKKVDDFIYRWLVLFGKL